MKYLVILYFSLLFAACGNDTVTNNSSQDTYQKIISAENGNSKFEVWTVNNDTLMTGYNKVGFRVYQNGSEKTSGFVKFDAKMFHFNSTSFHATPVEPLYNYNSSLGMFTGYIIMLMPSDTSSRWYGYYNYNDEFTVDSVNFDVGWNRNTKFKIFTDLSTELGYLITVITPESPVIGKNEFTCLFHESRDFLSFTQVNTAQMYLTPKLDSLNHNSTGNVNPVYIGGGIYKGSLNFDFSGGWKVYDSIYYNNKCVTQNSTPYIYFSVP